MSEVWADIGRRGKRINYSTRKRLTQDNIFLYNRLNKDTGRGMGCVFVCCCAFNVHVHLCGWRWRHKPTDGNTRLCSDEEGNEDHKITLFVS